MDFIELHWMNKFEPVIRFIPVDNFKPAEIAPHKQMLYSLVDHQEILRYQEYRRKYLLMAVAEKYLGLNILKGSCRKIYYDIETEGRERFYFYDNKTAESVTMKGKAALDSMLENLSGLYIDDDGSFFEIKKVK